MKTLIKNASVVTMDESPTPSLAADILVDGGSIAQVGRDLRAEAADVVDGSGMIACPGLVNAHVHSWQAGLRGIAGDWTTPRYMSAMHRGLATRFTPDDIYIATLVSSLNQLHNGCTTVFDWCHNNPTPAHTDAAVQALHDAGIRALFLHGSPKPDPKEGGRHYSEIPMPAGEIRRLRQGRLGSGGGLVQLGMAALGPQYGTFEVCRADLQLARELDIVVSLHTGGGPMLVPDGFERLLALGLIGARVNVVHANNIPQRTLRALIDAGANVTVTPDVELQMGFGDPVTGRVLEAGGTVTLGTDVEAAACSDLFGCLRSALLFQRNSDNVRELSRANGLGLTSSISCHAALRWLTCNAGIAMGRPTLGRLAAGHDADLVLLRKDDLNLFPVHEPVTSLVTQATAANVDSVMVAGRWVKRAGVLTGDLRLASLRSRLAESSARILRETQLQA
jgi:5-methylthioadenosine/S-adenosylhomocysteine deaminase